MPDRAFCPGKKTRKGVPKSSTGCITCKIRHVKCDETRPFCSMCLKSKRQCDGYSNERRKCDEKAIKIVHYRPKTVILRRVSVDIDGNKDERRAFHFFRSVSIEDLPGYFDSKFWSQLVVPACHTIPAIRHAAIALGSFHETTIRTYSEVVECGKGHDPFALQQCNKAIEHLTQDLLAKENRSIEAILMSIIILICFESLQGHYETALTHIHSGMRIFRNWQAESKILISNDASVSNNSHQQVDEEITHIFSRLNMQALLFPDTHLLRPEFITQNLPLVAPTPPSTFHTLHEAKNSLYSCFNFMNQSAATAAYLLGQGSLDESQTGPLDTLTRSTLLGQWLAAFNSFRRSFAAARLAPRERQCLVLLEIYHMTTDALIATGIPPDESVFDAFEPQFDIMLSLISSLSHDSGNPECAPPRTAPFSFELGIVPPLYLIATRCREPSIRSRALSMLAETCVQEGIWNSDMLSLIAERLVAIEVEDLDGVNCSADIPFNKRLTVLQATICSEKRRILLNLCRPMHDNSGELCLLEEWITY